MSLVTLDKTPEQRQMVFTELDLLKEVTYICGSKLIRLWSRPESQTNRGNPMQNLLLLNPL